MGRAQEATAPVPVPSRGTIVAVQQQLNAEGYVAGPANGVMTDKTRSAITAYERHTGRPPDALAPLGGDPVKRVQAGLRQFGFFGGPIDGTLGPETRDAIIRFEASRQLPIDPRVSDRLLAELDHAAPVSGSAPPATGAESAPMAQAGSPEPGRHQLPAWENPPPIR